MGGYKWLLWLLKDIDAVNIGSAMQAHGIGYLPDIVGLRAVAVMIMVLHHLSAQLVPMDMFFVISVYLITMIIQKEVKEGMSMLVRLYVRRRKSTPFCSLVEASSRSLVERLAK